MEQIEDALILGCNAMIFVMAVLLASYLLRSYHGLINQTYENTTREHIVEMKEDFYE